jgi:hypothetical protein
MVLLSQMFRSQAIYGSTDASWFKEIAGRQGGRWAEQHVNEAMRPRGSPARQPASDERMRALTDLHQRGVLTDAEYELLCSRTGLQNH